MLTKYWEGNQIGVRHLLKAASAVDVDTFIKQATKIARKSKRNPSLSVEAKREALVLWGQFEEYLEASLKASDNPATRLKSTTDENLDFLYTARAYTLGLKFPSDFPVDTLFPDSSPKSAKH